MQKTLTIVSLLALLGTTAPAFAQQSANQPVTRAQVVAEVKALQRVGYNPARAQGPDYPLNLQAAEKRLAAERDASLDYGVTTDSNSEAGKR